MPKLYEHVPARPFAEFLNARLAWHKKRYGLMLNGDASNEDPAVKDLVREIGWADNIDSAQRRLYRYRQQLRSSSWRARGSARDVLDWISWVEREGITELGKSTETARLRSRSHTLKGDVHADVFPRHTVEDALHHAGVPFEWLYPEIAAEEDVDLEPAVMCWKCEEPVHPVNGECLWCSSVVVGPLELAA